MIEPVPHSSGHLNDKQLRVLRWVERGCPDGEYVDDNYGHRITAKALAGRGLIRIEGRGKTWRATLTQVGTARLAELDTAPQREESLGNPGAVEQLRARLDSANDRLVVDTREDSADYRDLVQRFNESASRPRGKTLWPSSPDWGKHLVLEYRDWFWDLADIPEVRAVPSGSRLGPLAKAFMSNHDDQFVSKEALPRAARVLEALTRHAASIGVAARDPRVIDDRKKRNGADVRGWSGHLELVSGSATLRVQVRETPGPGSEKFDYYPDGDFDRRAYDRIQRLPAWQRSRNYAFVPSGRLEVRIARPGFGFDRDKLKDRKSSPLEERLGEIFQRLEVARLEGEASAQRAREAEDQKRQEWEAAMARARSLFHASQEESLLLEQAAIWRKHQEVSAFVDELRRRDDGSDSAIHAWIATGERVAARLDAFNALSAPAFGAPTANDLQPFLGTWSPWGPSRRAP